jgi:hypothetical protein
VIAVPVIIAVILVFVILRRPEGSGIPPPTELYIGDKDSFARNLLPGYTLEALNDSSSPQSRALEWLWKDPMATALLPNFRKVQRFALATSILSLVGVVITPPRRGTSCLWVADR